MAGMNLPDVRYELIRLQGGMDQVTPTLSLKPGVTRRAANFECSITGGYTRVEGYERFDGRPSPSAAGYLVIYVPNSFSVSVGNTVTGGTSAATGKVIAVTQTYLVVTKVVGTFAEIENIYVGATLIGESTATAGAVTDPSLDSGYRNLAADEYRGDIAAVPGEGPIRGVAYYKDTVYAWRDYRVGVPGTLFLRMYKSSSSGWTVVPLGVELSFDGGTGEILDGQTVTGATSGATATVKRVVLQDGDWSTSDASGRLIFAAVTGTFQNNENLQVGGVTKALANGTQSNIELTAGGRVEVAVGNFGGVAGYKLYGCDGKNRAFEFDGEVYVPLSTGMTVDKPEHVAFHKQHLFLAFGASLQFSAIGDPYKWTPLLGAGEIAMNEAITNLLLMPGDQTTGALAVYARNSTSILYGASSEDFRLATYNTGTGAMPYTAQTMDQAYALDGRGVMSLGTSLNFGNFLPSSLTMTIRPFIEGRINTATASAVQRDKGQYRAFFSDGTGVYVTILNGKLLGSMPVQFAHPVLCTAEGEKQDELPCTYFGSDNGFVYQSDVGTSFDGENIQANLTLVFDSIGSPRILKRYRRASVELTGASYAEIQFGYLLGYATREIDQQPDRKYGVDLRSPYWDSMVWDNFIWDGRDIAPTETEMTGTGENVAIAISSVSDSFKPFTVNSVIIHYSLRRGLR
jgi:hypothetical protein